MEIELITPEVELIQRALSCRASQTSVRHYRTLLTNMKGIGYYVFDRMEIGWLCLALLHYGSKAAYELATLIYRNAGEKAELTKWTAIRLIEQAVGL